MDENLFRAVRGAGCGSRTDVACELLEGVVGLVLLGLGELTGELKLVLVHLHRVNVSDAGVDVDGLIGGGGLDGVVGGLEIHVHVFCL